MENFDKAEITVNVENGENGEDNEIDQSSSTTTSWINDHVEPPTNAPAPTAAMDWSISDNVVERVDSQSELSAKDISTKAAETVHKPEPARLNMKTFAKKIMQAFMDAFPQD